MKIIKMIKVLRTSDSGQDVKLGTEFTPPQGFSLPLILTSVSLTQGICQALPEFSLPT